MSAATPSDNFPRHIAIIMDGNGRWAKARHRPRLFGHQEGVKAVKRIVESAADVGVKYLTLYSFSTENWSRPKAEIAALFGLLRRYVEEDLTALHKRNVKVNILGSRQGLKPDMLALLDKVEAQTKDNTAFTLNIAFNYGGRDEIVRAATRFAQDACAGKVDPSAMTEAGFERYLDTDGLPAPDLVIRTSGERRISNFLLWQAAYAEFIFTEVLWPDFNEADLKHAIEIYQNRDRRFGKVKPTAEVA